MVAARKYVVGVAAGLFGLVATAGYAASMKICTDANYKGTCTEIAADVPDLSKVAGPCNGSWDNCVSSVDLSDGMSVKVCNDANYKGECTMLKEDAKDLAKVKGPCNGTWDDCASSLDIQ